MTNEEFKKEIKWFSEFYQTEMNEMQGKIWAKILEKFSANILNQAFVQHIKNSENSHIPALGTIFKLCDGWKVQ